MRRLILMLTGLSKNKNSFFLCNLEKFYCKNIKSQASIVNKARRAILVSSEQMMKSLVFLFCDLCDTVTNKNCSCLAFESIHPAQILTYTFCSKVMFIFSCWTTQSFCQHCLSSYIDHSIIQSVIQQLLAQPFNLLESINLCYSLCSLPDIRMYTTCYGN